MESRFADGITSELFNGISSKKSRKALPLELHASAQRKLIIVVAAPNLESLRLPPGNMLEALKGDRQGQHSIRINGQYRICFVMTEKGATKVAVVDYH